MTRRVFTIAVVALGAVCSQAFAREAEAPREPLDVPEGIPLYDAPSLETAMFDDINVLRRRHDRVPLTFDEPLSEVARNYGREMLHQRYIGHIDRNGGTFFERLVRAGLPARHMGENLAYTTGGENEAFTHLVESTGHLANMLNSLFTRVGVGAIAIGLYGTMYVQEFEGD